MALQTETSTSSSSTATSSNGDDDVGFFNSTSSPPLILAFLSIGLVAAAIIAAMGWRRTYLRRGSHGMITRRPARSAPTVEVAESPKLWDLWTDVGESGMSEDSFVAASPTVDYHRWRKEITWEYVMPIAVSPQIDDRHPAVVVIQDGPAEVVHDQTSGLVAFILERLAQFDRYRMPERTVTQQTTEMMTQNQNKTDKSRGSNTASDDLKELRCKSLRITMAIAMPKPKKSGDDSFNEAEKVGIEYSIGICQVPWEQVEDRHESAS